MTIEVDVLTALERFRFLTRPQLLRAGIACSPDHLGDVLRRLQKRRLVGVVRPGVLPVVGRLHFVHYLREPGAAMLAEVNRVDLERLTWCAATPQLSHDYSHRLRCVDVHLWLARVVGAGLTSFFPYYTTAKADDGVMRRASRVLVDGQGFEPDALFTVEDKAGSRFGYVLEVQRAKSAAGLRDQLVSHAQVMREGIAMRRLGVDRAALLYVVENPRDLKTIREAATALPSLRGVLLGRMLASLEGAGRLMDGWEVLT